MYDVNDNNLKQKLIHNGMRMYILSFLIAPSGYLIKLMISKSVSVEEVGLFYSVFGLITLLSTFNDLWLTQALQYFLPQYALAKDYAKTKTIIILTRLVQFGGGIVIWAWLWYFAPQIAELYFQNSQTTSILRYFSLYFLLVNLFQVLQSIFTALQHVKYQYTVDAVRLWTVVFLVWGAILLWDSITLTQFTWMWISGLVMGLIVAGWLFWKACRYLVMDGLFVYDKSIFRQQRSYARKVMISMQAGVLFGQINQQFAILFLWPYAAGIWTNYLTFFTGVGIILWPIMGYLYPLFTELYNKQHTEKIKLMKTYLTRWTLVAAGGIAVGGWLFSEWAAVTLLTSDYLMSGTLFQWTSLAYVVVIITQIQFTILSAAGYPGVQAKILTIGVLASLWLSYIGIHYRGLWGLVWSLLITHLYFVLHGRYAMWRLGV